MSIQFKRFKRWYTSVLALATLGICLVVIGGGLLKFSIESGYTVFIVGAVMTVTGLLGALILMAYYELHDAWKD